MGEILLVGIDHGIDAHFEASLVVEGVHEEDDLFGDPAVGDRGEARAEAVFLGCQQGPGHDITVGWGDDGGHRGFRVVDENPRRLAVAEEDLPAVDPGGGCDARQFQSPGVAPGGMAVDADQINRHPGKEPVEFFLVGKLLHGPVILVPAPAQKPRSSRFFMVLLQPGVDFFR